MRGVRHRWPYRANVAARVLAATGGSYAVAASIAFAGARLIPLARLDAVIAATLLAFLILPAAAIWAFLARSARHAWGGIAIVCALLGAGAWWIGAPA